MIKEDSSITDRQTSYHEAGHSIANLVLFGEARAVRIFDSGGFAAGAAGPDGFEVPVASDFSDDKIQKDAEGTGFKDCFSRAVVKAAGHAACQILCGRSGLPNVFSPSRPDDQAVEELARVAFGRAIDRAVVQSFSQLAHVRAVDLLGRRWAGVKVVAEKLLTDRHLPSGEVAATYAQGLAADEPN